MNLQPNSQVTLQGTKPAWHCHSLDESLALLKSSFAPGWNSTCGCRIWAWQEVFEAQGCFWPQRALSRYQRCIAGNIFVFYSLKFTTQLHSQHLKSRIFFTLSLCAGAGRGGKEILIHPEAEKNLTKKPSKTGGLNSLKLYYMLE